MAKSAYRIGSGWNVNDTSLVLFNPQPRSLGVQFTKRNFLNGGFPYDEGPYIELMWSALDSEVVYQSLLAKAGLTSQYTNQVTVSVRDDAWIYRRYNGNIIRPTPGNGLEWDYFPRNVVFLIRDLLQLS